jgi:ATP-dependent helicase/nuclease subunit B
MQLATIPFEAPFLDTLARHWLARHRGAPGAPLGDALAEGLILLPTRRAARALADAFLRVSGGAPLLLPRITALGALDEAPLALAGALDLPPPVDEMQRLAVLARMVLGLPEQAGGVRGADRAWRLAVELAALMDEAERAELSLPEALARAADGAHAAHWQITLEFLTIVTRFWPDWLAGQGFANPAERQVRLLRAQARAWADQPPSMPVWVAGISSAQPAIGALLRVVARMPQGAVILAGLDQALPDAVWDQLEPTHPQAGLRAVLAQLDARRGDVAVWNAEPVAPPGRVRTLAEALLPAPALATWRAPAPAELTGLRRLAPVDQQEEAVAIALVMRDALAQQGATVALVTPDRALAGRVTAELGRFGVVADDSAGEPLAETPPAVFLRLLARAVAEQLAPVALLALLKHPFAAAGLSPASCRTAARRLEIAALRGPRPLGGLAGLRRAAEKAGERVENLLDRIETCLAPALRVAASVEVAPKEALTALVESAEMLAATDAAPGPARLWGQEEGDALAAHLAAAIDALAHLPDQPPAVLPELLDALLAGEVVRSRRALRGSDAGAEHPRVFIWGLLEARLQSVDVAVLGGLVEGVWPPMTDPGPWMSRQMRARAGLPSPEERIGEAAHDFSAIACAARVAVLSCPRRRDGAPAVPSRWLARLDAYLAGQNRAVPPHPAATWARLLDQPAGDPKPVAPPAPCPPVDLRPRKLSVTEIETWIADPYAIHARHILRLRPLPPLEEETDASDYGSLVHKAIHRFLAEHGALWPAGAAEHLARAMDRTLAEADLRPALREWWGPRLRRIAHWVARTETERRAGMALVRVLPEIEGDWPLPAPRGFRLTGRADRIERRADGTIAILDYKTGIPPSAAEVANGHAPQLPLEAAMAAAGAFGPDAQGPAAELAYWRLTGGFEPGALTRLLKDGPAEIATAAATAEASLRRLIAAFDDPARPYLSQPHPGRRPRFPEYAHLARVAEWESAEDSN